MKLVSAEHLPAYLGGSLCLVGTDTSRPGTLQSALDCYRHLLGRGHYHLPFFLVADLLNLVTSGYQTRFLSERAPTTEESDDVRVLRSRYERECLGRLLQSPDVITASEIIETTPDPGQRRRVLELLCNSLAPCYPREWQVNPAQLRDLSAPSLTRATPEELLATLSGAEEAHPFLPQLGQFLNTMNEEVRWGSLLHEEDFFELTHFAALSSDYLRLGSRQLIELNRKLESTGLLQGELKPNEDDVDTAFLDETHYPTGGITGLSNRGSFENLVMSELSYMDEGTRDVSLFDLRFVENELLFYLRDSGNLRRKRRTIHFVFDLGELITTKAIGYDYQYSVLLHGLALRFIDDLFALFELDSLRFKFHHLVDQASAEFLDGERGLLKTVLADYLRHGWVDFSTCMELELPNLPDPKRKTYAIVFASPERISFWQQQQEAATAEELPVTVALCQVGPNQAGPTDLPASGLDLTEIRARKDEMLKALVS